MVMTWDLDLDRIVRDAESLNEKEDVEEGNE